MDSYISQHVPQIVAASKKLAEDAGEVFGQNIVEHYDYYASHYACAALYELAHDASSRAGFASRFMRDEVADRVLAKGYALRCNPSLTISKVHPDFEEARKHGLRTVCWWVMLAVCRAHMEPGSTLRHYLCNGEHPRATYG